jgi:hypothetical protein
MKTIFIDKMTWNKINRFKNKQEPFIDLNRYLKNCKRDEVVLFQYDNEKVYLKIINILIFDSIKDYMMNMDIDVLDVSILDIKDMSNLLSGTKNSKKVKYFKFVFSNENDFKNNYIFNDKTEKFEKSNMFNDDDDCYDDDCL